MAKKKKLRAKARGVAPSSEQVIIPDDDSDPDFPMDDETNLVEIDTHFLDVVCRNISFKDLPDRHHLSEAQVMRNVGRIEEDDEDDDEDDF